MSWQILLKAPSVSGEQELPDTKLMYVMYLSAPNGLEVVRQIIQTNKSNRGIRNIPKWNQQIINTEIGRLGRKYPQIRNIEDVQKNANALASDMTELTTRDVSYKSIETKLKDLIDAQDFEGIENFLHSDDKNPGKRKRAVSMLSNELKSLISTSPPDMYIDAYYYLTTTTSVSIMDDNTKGKTITSPVSFGDVDLPSPDFSTIDLGQALKGWVRIRDGKLHFVNKKGKFSGKIPPYVKLALEETLGSKLKLTPSKLVKYIGGDISPGMHIEQQETTDYELNVETPEDVFNYLNLLVKLGINSNEFMLGNPPGLFYNTVLKRKDANTSMIYPALRVILKEPQFNVEDWYMSDKGTKESRAENYLRDKFLREWKVTRTRQGEKISEEDISEDIQQEREEELVEGGFEELRVLFTKSPTERKRLLRLNKDGIRDLYNDYMDSVKETLKEGRFLFSEENYDFLVELESNIDKGIDVEKLANHFGLQDATGISETLEDILTNDIMESTVTMSDLFDEPTTVGTGAFKYTGRRLSSNLKKRILEQLEGNPSEDLKDLKKDIDTLYDFLVKNKQATKPAEKKKLIQALKDMDSDSIDVSDFSPTQLVLEDIIEMMCQLNWLFGNKSLIQIRNRFSRAIKEGTAKKQIPKFITDFEGEYSKIREQLVKVTKDKINNMIESEKSITHYDRLVRKNYKTADFFGRMVDIGVLMRA